MMNMFMSCVPCKTKSLLLAVFSCLSVCMTAADSFPEIPRINEGITLDGDLTEAVWKQGAVCKVNKQVMGDRSIEPATVRIIADDLHIYIGAELLESNPKGPGINALPTHGRSINYGVRQAGSDNLGVILDLGKDGFSAYVSLFVNALGEHCVYGTWPKHASSNLTGLQFPNKIKSAAKINTKDKLWTLELQIPWVDILKYPTRGIPKYIAMNFRRTQWGDDIKGLRPSTMWNFSVERSAKRMKNHYEHMVSWQPMLSAPIWVKHNFDISFQYPYPSEVGVLKVAGGTLDNKVVTGGTEKLKALYETSWMKIKHPGWDEKPRLQRWDDLRPSSFPDRDTRPLILAKPRVLQTGLKFASAPSVRVADDKVTVAFTLSHPSDVVVTVLDKRGSVVRVLGHGLLGKNAPVPFQKNSLSQSLVWDFKDAAGIEVEKGSYTIEVQAGLKTSLKRIIDMKLDKKGKPSWPELLDVEAMPNPQPNQDKMKKHDHGGGGGNHLAIDIERGEVYLPGYKVYDIETGAFVRKFNFQHSYPSGLVQSGELEIHNGNFYIAGWNELWKVDAAGKGVAWRDLGKPFIANLFGGHSNPRRGMSVGADGSIYVIHHRGAHGNTDSDITKIGPHGEIKQYGIVTMKATTTTGTHVDSRGNIYVGAPIKPQEEILPKDVDGQLSEFARNVYGAVYGSITKFSPAGGSLVWDDSAKKFSAPRNQTGSDLKSCRLAGAEWVLPGLSPALPRARGKSFLKCPCRRGDFDIDLLDRIFMPDAIMGRVHVADPAGNIIATIGKRGSNINDLELRWPTYVIANKEYLFIADFLHEKCLQLNLAYELNAVQTIQKKSKAPVQAEPETKPAPVNLEFPTFPKLGAHGSTPEAVVDKTPQPPLRVTLGKALFKETFSNGLDAWQLEHWEDGDAVTTTLSEGQLKIDTDSKTHGMMLWHKRALPGDFQFEFDFTPLSADGFFLLFFCYKGKDGKSILEDSHLNNKKFPTLFKKYTKGNSNGYHISYRRGDAADCNFRKNAGQHLMKKNVLKTKLPTGKTVHVVLTKKGGRCVLTVDGEVFMDYLDTDAPYAGGTIGFRQVYKSSARYDNIKISEVE